MNRQDILKKIDEASNLAGRHVGGQRESGLPAYLDPQVERFLKTLLQMKARLENPTEATKVPDKYMGHAIADGWPFDSELGRLICEAENAFHSRAAD